MKVVLAKTLGFCGGVRRAVDMIYKELETVDGNSVLMEGPIIHNPTVINDLNSKGVELLSNSNNLEGKKIVIRAHGVSPLVKNDIEKRGGTLVDGTCPIVNASQIKIRKFVDDGYFIVIAGDKGHAEVIGLVGQSPENCIVVADINDIKKYKYPEKTVLLSQTTFSKPEFLLIEKELREICPTLKSLNTICGATKDRQDAVIELAKIVEAIIVVGGITSSNTKRLQKAVDSIVPTWLIEDYKDIPNDIKNYNTVGVTAGASTPDSVIKMVIQVLESY